VKDAIAFEGRLYRALNPLWAGQPLSGEGAALYGGRFNRRTVPALYCSLSPVTALREAHQAGDLQPTMLVAFDAAIDRVFDARSSAALRRYGLTAEALADAGWRNAMIRGEPVPTQQLADALATAGFHGVLVRSFARGTTEADLNLVLWRWSDAAPHRLTLIDEENRLGR